MTPAAAAAAYHRRLVGWLSSPQLITWGGVFYTFALLMAPLERELGLTRAQSSLAFSLALLAEGLLAYPIGRWIDRGHERAVMTGGSLLIALCLFLHSFVTSVAGFYAVWLLLGASLAATLYNPARHHHADVSGRPGQHGFHSAVGLADCHAGLAPCAVGAGGAASAGVCAAGGLAA